MCLCAHRVPMSWRTDNCQECFWFCLIEFSELWMKGALCFLANTLSLHLNFSVKKHVKFTPGKYIMEEYSHELAVRVRNRQQFAQLVSPRFCTCKDVFIRTRRMLRKFVLCSLQFFLWHEYCLLWLSFLLYYTCATARREWFSGFCARFITWGLQVRIPPEPCFVFFRWPRKIIILCFGHKIWFPISNGIVVKHASEWWWDPRSVGSSFLFSFLLQIKKYPHFRDTRDFKHCCFSTGTTCSHVDRMAFDLMANNFIRNVHEIRVSAGMMMWPAAPAKAFSFSFVLL